MKHWPTADDIKNAWPDEIEPPSRGQVASLLASLRSTAIRWIKRGDQSHGWIEAKDYGVLRDWVRTRAKPKAGGQSGIKAERMGRGWDSNSGDRNYACRGPVNYDTGGGRRVIRSGKEMS